MVMPVSRYLAGDFVTPMMAMSWKTGVAYRIAGPDDMREIPPNQPFGGPDAPAKRRQAIQTVIDALAPAFRGTVPWDEASEATPRFERVDPRSFEAMCEHVVKLTRGSKLERFLRRPADPGPAHLLGTLFVPAELRGAFELEAPMEGIMTSALEALRQLQRPFPEAAASACATLRTALTAARELNLPMIVDA
jgi:hypothetical protein